MVTMNDLEWPMLSYYVIYYETFRKVMQRTEKEALTITTLVLNSVPSVTHTLLWSQLYWTFQFLKLVSIIFSSKDMKEYYS